MYLEMKDRIDLKRRSGPYLDLKIGPEIIKEPVMMKTGGSMIAQRLLYIKGSAETSILLPPSFDNQDVLVRLR